MFTTVTLNPAIDKSIILGEVALGNVNRIEQVVKTAGGKGINVSKVLNFFDVDSMATGILGRDNQAFFDSYLDKSGIPHAFLTVEGTTRTNVKVIETKHQRTTDLNEPGIHLPPHDLQIMKKQLTQYAMQSECVVLSGSLPTDVDDGYYAELIKTIKPYTMIALDTSGVKLKKGVKAGADLIKPNKEELEEAFDVQFGSDEDCISFCSQLIRDNQLQTVLLTLGGDGAVLISERYIYKSRPIKVDVINTVGAGDCFLGGYLAGISQKKSEKQAFQMAVACGTLAVMQKGTDIFSKDAYKTMFGKVVVQEQ